jgi:hypothetical protein
MGIYDFNILNEHDKYDCVFTRGQFVDVVSDIHIKYVLYSVSYFWVEVRYDAQTNKIIGIASFVSGTSLNRYSNVPKEI